MENQSAGGAPIALRSYLLEKNSINRPEIHILAENVSGEAVRKFSMQLFAFDAEGAPAKVRFGEYSMLLSCPDMLAPGARTAPARRWTLHGNYSSIRQVVVILREAEFCSGTRWENPCCAALCEKYDGKPLEAGDENILPRG